MAVGCFLVQMTRMSKTAPPQRPGPIAPPLSCSVRPEISAIPRISSVTGTFVSDENENFCFKKGKSFFVSHFFLQWNEPSSFFLKLRI